MGQTCLKKLSEKSKCYLPVREAKDETGSAANQTQVTPVGSGSRQPDSVTTSETLPLGIAEPGLVSGKRGHSRSVEYLHTKEGHDGVGQHREHWVGGMFSF